MSLGVPLAAHQHLAAADGVRRPSRCREDLPDYPSHWQIAAYFDAYVDHFGLRDKITFRTEVVKVEPGRRGGYDVTLRGRTRVRRPGRARDPHLRARGRRQRAPLGPALAGAVLPGRRDVPGRAAARALLPHARRARRQAGAGARASATPPATSRSSPRGSPRETYLAMRRGAHIVPKYMFGVPTDHLTDSPLARGPLRLQQLGDGRDAAARAGQGDRLRAARSPTTPCSHAHPTVSDDLLTRLGHGDITVKPNIDRFEGVKVFFTDGRAVEVDVVVYCTGYKVTLPVPRRAGGAGADDNHVDLYRRVVAPRPPGPLLHRADPAARRDHAAGRGAGGLGGRPGHRRGRAAVVRRDARARSGRTTSSCASATSPRSGTPSRSTSTPTSPSSPGSAGRRGPGPEANAPGRAAAVRRRLSPVGAR